MLEVCIQCFIQCVNHIAMCCSSNILNTPLKTTCRTTTMSNNPIYACNTTIYQMFQCLSESSIQVARWYASGLRRDCTTTWFLLVVLLLVARQAARRYTSRVRRNCTATCWFLLIIKVFHLLSLRRGHGVVIGPTRLVFHLLGWGRFHFRW